MILKIIVAILVAVSVLQQCQIESLERCIDTTTRNLMIKGSIMDVLLDAHEDTAKTVDEILAYIN